MSDRLIERYRLAARPKAWRGAGASVAQRLLIGGGLLAFGLVALTQTARFVPWSLWGLVWPLGIVAAGVLLLAYGGRNTVIAGFALVAVGGLFLIGAAWSLFWLAATVLWPLAPILAGLAILIAGLRQFARGSDV
jgi:hypothetical protein